MKNLGTTGSDAAGLPERIESGIGLLAANAEEIGDRLADAMALARRRLNVQADALAGLRSRWAGAANRCAREHPVTSAGVVLMALAVVAGAVLAAKRTIRE